MNPEQIANAMLPAIRAFLEKEHELLVIDVNERSLTHKLAEYLQQAFPDWHVDCEYNRLGDKVKKLPQPESVSTDDTDGRSIFPDIIVHRRHTNENLLVIEVKKATNKYPGDELKLCGLTAEDGVYAYTLGMHLVIDCAHQSISNVTAFRQGSANEELTAFVHRALGQQRKRFALCAQAPITLTKADIAGNLG